MLLQGNACYYISGQNDTRMWYEVRQRCTDLAKESDSELHASYLMLTSSDEKVRIRGRFIPQLSYCWYIKECVYKYPVIPTKGHFHTTAMLSTLIKALAMVRWVVGSILHGGPLEQSRIYPRPNSSVGHSCVTN